MNSIMATYIDSSNNKPIVVRARKLLISINPDDMVHKF